MKPEEKAKELMNRFNDHVCECDCLNESHEHDEYSGFCSIQSIYHKKQCALICVDEIIKSSPCKTNYLGAGISEFIINTKYWNEVKSIIENS